MLSATAMATPHDDVPIAASARSTSAAPARPGEPPVLVAVAAGAVTAMIPVILGGTHAATGETLASKNVGLSVAGFGLALAPIISHVVVGEWKRAAAFGALPTATAIGAAVLLASRDDAVFDGTTLSRSTFGALFSLTVFSSALGVVDAALAGERARAPGLIVAPTLGKGHFGIGIMTTL